MSRQLPPLNPLRAFEAAARHLSFTRAAEELFVTPSAVSHQVKALEENLGVSLFLRDSKSLLLTPAGKAYLPGVQEAFRQLAFATYQLHRERSIPALKLNLPPTFALKWLIPRMKSFVQTHPEIDLKVSTSKHMVDFAREDFDLAVRYGRGVYPGLRAEHCLNVEVFPVCAPSLLEGPVPLREPDDLRLHRLLHDDSTYDDVTNPNWATWLEHAGVEGVDTTRGPSFWPSHLVIDATIDGLGVALAKRSWVERDLLEGRLVRPFADLTLSVEFSYFFVYPQDRADDPRLRLFMDWVRQEVARDDQVDSTAGLQFGSL